MDGFDLPHRTPESVSGQICYLSYAKNFYVLRIFPLAVSPPTKSHLYMYFVKNLRKKQEKWYRVFYVVKMLLISRVEKMHRFYSFLKRTCLIYSFFSPKGHQPENATDTHSFDLLARQVTTRFFDRVLSLFC